MRKLLIALAAVAVLGVAASVAWAANDYDIDLADAGSAKGSKTRPVASIFKFGFTSQSQTPGNRPDTILGFNIGVEGGKFFPAAHRACTFAQANDPAATSASGLPRACRRAIVGRGTIDNEIGATNAPQERANCLVQMTLLNAVQTRAGGDPREPATQRQVDREGGLLIRIDTDPPNCIASVHEALVAPFYDTRIAGVAASELRFTVPDTLRHPGGVLSLAITEVESTVNREVGFAVVKHGAQAAARRRVGYFSLVGRKGRTRTLRVRFREEESGRTVTETRTFR
jgi:hypothetical protein